MDWKQKWLEYRALCVAAFYLSAVGGAVGWRDGSGSGVLERMTVRTTAYTHSEADHLIYGQASAAGTKLRSGKVTSAAADWSFLPVGTKFRIEGESTVYLVEDYGGALVGTETIDLYRSSMDGVDDWGVREVGIEIIERGSAEESIGLLEGRGSSHTREMLERLRSGGKN